MNFTVKQLRTMFLKMEEQERDVIVTKKAYVDLTGDLIAGILLSQIAYWHKPSKKNIENGASDKSRLKIRKYDDQSGEMIEWLAKGREDWWDEIRISPKQFDRACKILLEKGYIDKKTFKFNSNPTVHVRIIWEKFLPDYMKITGIFQEDEAENNEPSDEVNEENGNQHLEPVGFSPNGENDFTEKEITILPDGEERFLLKGENDFTEMEKTILLDGEERFSPFENNVLSKKDNSLTETTNNEYNQKNTNITYNQSFLNDDDDEKQYPPSPEQVDGFAAIKEHLYQDLTQWLDQLGIRHKSILQDCYNFLFKSRMYVLHEKPTMNAIKKIIRFAKGGGEYSSLGSLIAKEIIQQHEQLLGEKYLEEQMAAEAELQRQLSQRRNIPGFYNWLEEREE